MRDRDTTSTKHLMGQTIDKYTVLLASIGYNPVAHQYVLFRWREPDRLDMDVDNISWLKINSVDVGYILDGEQKGNFRILLHVEHLLIKQIQAIVPEDPPKVIEWMSYTFGREFNMSYGTCFNVVFR